jgi:protocatechuate 3,4-dioxygenase beta subunit
MKQVLRTRRKILTGLLAVGGNVALAKTAAAAPQTPRASEGPYYPEPKMRFPDTDNDLVKISGLVRKAGGEIFTLNGQIFDATGNPLAGHRIEIWQCDMNGKYLHPGDSRKVAYDQGFQGFGHDITDGQGRYSFRTIKPGKYPGRTPHIHVKVFDDAGREVLTTQFYEAGNAENKRDGLFRRMSDAQAKSVSMTYGTGTKGLEATVNVTLA